MATLPVLFLQYFYLSTYITSDVFRDFLPANVVGGNSFFYAPGGGNTSSFANAHTGELNAHGGLQDKAGADATAGHNKIWYLIGNE